MAEEITAEENTYEGEDPTTMISDEELAEETSSQAEEQGE